MIRAAADGDAEAVRSLLAAGEEVNAASPGGQTPLILASIFGHEEVALLLLQAGADPSLRDERGLNAAEWAIRRGFPNLAQIVSNAAPRVPAAPSPAPPERTSRPEPESETAPREQTETPRMGGAAGAILRTRAAASFARVDKTSKPTESADPFAEVVFRGKEISGANTVTPEAPTNVDTSAETAPSPAKENAVPETSWSKPDATTLSNRRSDDLAVEGPVDAPSAELPSPVARVAEKRSSRLPETPARHNARPAYTMFAETPPTSSGRPLIWALVVITLGASAFAAYRLNSYFAGTDPVVAPATAVTAATPAPSPAANLAADTAAPAVSEKFPVTGGPLAGTESNLPEPAYPAAAKRRGLAGTVTITVRVNRAGKVVSWRSEDGEPLLRAAALRAARRSTFNPAKLPGKGEVVGTITYKFARE